MIFAPQGVQGKFSKVFIFDHSVKLYFLMKYSKTSISELTCRRLKIELGCSERLMEQPNIRKKSF